MNAIQIKKVNTFYLIVISKLSTEIYFHQIYWLFYEWNINLTINASCQQQKMDHNKPCYIKGNISLIHYPTQFITMWSNKTKENLLSDFHFAIYSSFWLLWGLLVLKVTLVLERNNWIMFTFPWPWLFLSPQPPLSALSFSLRFPFPSVPSLQSPLSKPFYLAPFSPKPHLPSQCTISPQPPRQHLNILQQEHLDSLHRERTERQD